MYLSLSLYIYIYIYNIQVASRELREPGVSRELRGVCFLLRETSLPFAETSLRELRFALLATCPASFIAVICGCSFALYFLAYVSCLIFIVTSLLLSYVSATLQRAQQALRRSAETTNPRKGCADKHDNSLVVSLKELPYVICMDISLYRCITYIYIYIYIHTRISPYHSVRPAKHDYMRFRVIL